MLKHYIKYREENQIQDSTIKYEVEQLESFLRFVEFHNKRKLEPFEIKPSDVRAYLKFQKTERQVKDSTLQRKLSAIRQYFHYLWKIGKVPHDFMPKFEYTFNVPQKVGETNYMELLSKKTAILKDTKLLLNDKLYFLFALRGIKLKDIEQLRERHLIDFGHKVELVFNNSNDYVVEHTFTEDAEIAVLLQALERSTFRGHDILISSTNQKEPNYIRSNMKEISKRLHSVLDQPFRGEEIRLSYIHFMYKVEGKTIEEMSEELGSSVASIAASFKVVLERYKHIDYNKATN